MDMYTQGNVFADGMREGQTRLSLERAEPSTLKEAFAIALREDLRVTKAYTKPSVVIAVRSAGPEPMDIDAIESSSDRRSVTSYMSEVRSGRQMTAFDVESRDIAWQNASRQHLCWRIRRTPITREVLRPLGFKTDDTSRGRAPF
uniref:Uncharacterized protein n=1 Tax=Peronospora matthiolae TaxID=2874970 RepID=A0AAV1UL96_9STRA